MDETLNQIASLEEKLKTAKVKEQFKLYHTLIQLWFKKDITKALDTAERLEDLAVDVNDLYWQISALIAKFRAYDYMGKSVEAVEGFEEILPIAVEYDYYRLAGSIAGNLGNAFRNSNPEKAIQYVHQSLEYARKSKNDLFVGISLINLSEMHKMYGMESPDDIEYAKEAIDIFKATNHPDYTITAYSCLSANYSTFSKFDLAQKALDEGMEYAKEIGKLDEVFFLKMASINMYGEQKKHPRIIEAAKELIPELEERKSLRELRNIYMQMGESYLELGELIKAKETFAKAKELIPTGGKLTYIRLNEFLERIANLEGNYQEGYELLKERFTIYQEVNDAEKTKTITKLKEEFDSARKDKENAELKLKALRSQMNPHFIFNSLNAIQSYVSDNNNVDAIKYIAQFARLMRQILNGSEQVSVLLEEQIDFIKNYLRLECLRFNNRFNYEIDIDDELEPDIMKVPPMILQPYVENAIIHGMKGETQNGLIKISYQLMEDDEHILCVVSDNGQGRKAATDLKRKHKSLGTKITEERLKALKDEEVKVKIIDLKDEAGNPLGTRVEVVLPIVE